MAYKISSDCTSCGACASDCPVEAIIEGETQYQIIEENCLDCGACLNSCPVDAISE